jgi:trans-2,3-dihydro-3-hydroxyanthranilate isomerase
MTELHYRIVNVFTRDEGRLTGNPLCVFEDGRALDSETMQQLALQFNLSETTFLLPSTRADAAVRIFTPGYEMPFAGHPTLGTAFVCSTMRNGANPLTLEMPAGIIPVSAAGNRWTLKANAPRWRELETDRESLAAMLNLSPADIGERPLWVNTGKEQLIIPLTSEQAVRRVRPDSRAFAAVKSIDGHSMAYVFAETSPGNTLARFFFPQGTSLLEDPATGSATANFGGWLIATKQTLPQSFRISQGEYTGRPSTLLVNVDAEQNVFVSGDVVELGRGTIQL